MFAIESVERGGRVVAVVMRRRLGERHGGVRYGLVEKVAGGSNLRLGVSEMVGCSDWIVKI